MLKINFVSLTKSRLHSGEAYKGMEKLRELPMTKGIKVLDRNIPRKIDTDLTDVRSV